MKEFVISEAKAETAVLVGLITNQQDEAKTKEYLDELEFLADTAGAVVVKRFTQKVGGPSSVTYVGSGKLQEIKEYVKLCEDAEEPVGMVIFDDELTAKQIRNIEKELQVKILDRTSLILDIFAMRAQTAEAKAQVELAQHRYMLPRLQRLWTHLERQGGGSGSGGGKGSVGLRGPGETQLEMDRRIILQRITLLKQRLAEIDKQKTTQRKNRGRLIRVALVGYTNVGKSTMMNLLSKSEVFAENKLFATLDTTVRKVTVDNLPFLLADTVGFIRKLPSDLVESFKSTLDEVREADLLVHVVDISHPDFEEQITVVEKTLAELGCADKPSMIVFNKIDAYTWTPQDEDDLTEPTRENISLDELKRTWMANFRGERREERWSVYSSRPVRRRTWTSYGAYYIRRYANCMYRNIHITTFYTKTMSNYRQLTQNEIDILENNVCWAEDWQRVQVAEGFKPYNFHRVMFYGDIRLGEFHKMVEVTKGFFKHSGINDATLRNATVGDDCLIEKVGNYINNYTIGNDCYISNICTLETTDDATYGEGSVISVLNEMGDGNVTIFRELNSQMAALMVKYNRDKELRQTLQQMIEDELRVTRPERGLIGNNVKIINAKDITNTIIKGYCEISGASRLSECTVMSSMDAPVFIGTGVICENSIICDGCSINNSVKMQDCFVGEACQITNGFTAEASLFFANSFMANGEACAAFCGPFSASHHKSSLLIGGEFSFYNAGSNTNFSNHAYKMGPLHYGTLERGTKTASGSYILMPATIGAFSVCFGKLMHHPDTRCLPFSYLVAYGDDCYLVPGRNITTVGLYRDIKKWPKRDKRSKQSRKSIINFDWLSPFTVGEIMEGIKILKALREASGDNVSTYNFHEYVINASSLRKGLKYYDIALRIFMGAVLKRAQKEGYIGQPVSSVGKGRWVDLSGLLMPESEEQRLIDEIKSGAFDNIQQVLDRFSEINNRYSDYRWAWSYQMILDYYHLDELDAAACERIHEDYVRARRAWIAEIRKDAEKEFAMGDVEQEVFDDFLSKLDHEIDYEN